MAVSSIHPRLVFSHCVVSLQNLSSNSVAIFFIHHAKSESKPLEKCMYVCHYNTGYASTHYTKTGDTTYEALFHATCSIMQCSWQPDYKKNTIRHFPITTIKTSYSRIMMDGRNKEGHE